MDFKDWFKAVREGKVLYRIRPTHPKSLYPRPTHYFVEQWVWWFPFKWKRVYGKSKGWYVDGGWTTLEDCKEFVEQGTIMYEREKND